MRAIEIKAAPQGSARGQRKVRPSKNPAGIRPVAGQIPFDLDLDDHDIKPDFVAPSKSPVDDKLHSSS